VNGPTAISAFIERNVMLSAIERERLRDVLVVQRIDEWRTIEECRYHFSVMLGRPVSLSDAQEFLRVELEEPLVQHQKRENA